MSRFGTQVAQLCGLTAFEDERHVLTWYDSVRNKIITDDQLNAGILMFLQEYKDDDRRTERTDH